ncbi:MAG: hypothetical protein AB8B49_04910 [Nitratireductor sp.]
MRVLKNTFYGAVLGLTLAASATTQAASEEVYMIRGFANVFSAGMNQMTNKLKASGIKASVHSNGEWSRLADNIIKRKKQGRVSFPIVIVGHSLGGVELPQMANKLGKAGIPTKLVIGLDAGFANPQPFTKGAQQVIHYKIPTGHNLRKGAGFKGSISNKSISYVDHVGIDKHPRVQAQVIANIKRAVGK